ncbi:MAG: rod shape-determining protein RodA [Muribaculaceae bacterium]|nr:rod shape-determining protein RodA [Muribaculaceae bacterium]
MELRNTNTQPSFLHGVDWFTVVLYTILVVLGAISIYAASYDFDNASIFSFDEFSGKQLLWIALSFVIGLVLLLLDRRIYETYAFPIYVGMLLLLLVTIFISPNIKGSHSWIALGPMSLQPAEFAKFATALALAKLFGGYNFILNARPANYFRALAIIFLPVMLILAQNETGSALVYLSLFFVLYREGMSGLVLFAAAFAVVIFVVALKFSQDMIMGITVGQFAVFIMVMLLMVVMLAFHAKHTVAARNVAIGFGVSGLLVFIFCELGLEINGYIYFIAAIVIASVYIVVEMLKSGIKKMMVTVFTALISISFLFSINYVFTTVLQPHQQQRINVTLGIVEDLRGKGYNVNQSKIAIGSGGLAGKGFLKGTQTKLKYVPEQHTDFIFCTIGEEEGFIGTITVLALFMMLILRILAIAERQPTTFGRVYAYCVASYLIFHFCINIGMVIGLTPVIGIPLPFFSYGGSSLWGFTFLIFILLRIDAGRREYH